MDSPLQTAEAHKPPHSTTETPRSASYSLKWTNSIWWLLKSALRRWSPNRPSLNPILLTHPPMLTNPASNPHAMRCTDLTSVTKKMNLLPNKLLTSWSSKSPRETSSTSTLMIPPHPWSMLTTEPQWAPASSRPVKLCRIKSEFHLQWDSWSTRETSSEKMCPQNATSLTIDPHKTSMLCSRPPTSRSMLLSQAKTWRSPRLLSDLKTRTPS